ncbi:MAG: FtsW/RodA/SpoVE family cell cycle protein [bacterium]
MSKVDKPLLISFLVLLTVGITVFVSASLGIYATNQAKFTSVVFSHLFLGLVLGGLACYIFSKINYRQYRKYAFYIFILSLIAGTLVFVPGLGVSQGGAKRWIYLFGVSFQPLELIKIAFVIYFAAWVSGIKDKIAQFKFGLLPLLTLLGIIGGILLMQPDTDSLVVIAIVGFAMYIIGGGRWRDVFIIGIIGLIGLTVLLFSRPYLMNRMMTFINPSDNALTSGYQIQQSLIAIGSGEITGRGLGQSIQKYKFLPESIGDSIFAVAGEELGFIGSVFIIILFIFFTGRGLKVATSSTDIFGRLLATGIVILISIQSLMNISSMTGIIPLSGQPLIFFSQGGTALFFTLVEIGILLNISKFRKTN